MVNYVVKKGTIKGTSKRDKITWKGQKGWQRALTVKAGKGNDKILKAQGGAYINGGDGKDTITAIAGSNTIYGGTGDDSITINSIITDTGVYCIVAVISGNGITAAFTPYFVIMLAAIYKVISCSGINSVIA